MSSLGSPNPLLFGAAKDYEIDRSVRFFHTDGQILSRTAGTSTSQNKFTFSTWVKLCRAAEGTDDYGELLNGYTGDNDAGFSAIYFYNGALKFGGYNSNWRVTNRIFRDPSSWYHIIVAVDTTLGTADNRVKMYINGVEETSFSASNNPGQNDTFGISNNSAAMQIGRDNSASSSRRFDGYMAETYFIDGQQLTASSFGETHEDTGQWVAKKYAGTYGNNGFYLKFDDNSGTTATTLGKDSSGNGNNWTPNNFSVSAGTGNDSLTDTPTNNYCTWNILDYVDGGFGTSWGAGARTANGALEMTASGKNTLWHGTFFKNSGKWYYESTGWNHDQIKGGWGRSATSAGTEFLNANCFTLNQNGQFQSNSPTGTAGGTTYGGSISSSDVIGCAIDLDNLTVAWSKNGQWGDGSGNWDETYSGANKISITAGYWTPTHIHGGSSAGQCFANFGQRPFANDPPSGFKTLCASDIPTPTIKNGTDHFNTILYTGNATTRSLPGVGFQPDFTWIKMRSDTEDQQLYDSVRGTTKDLRANLTTIENANVQGLNSFNADGFSVGNMPNVNQNTKTFAAWNWKGGGTASSNGDGTITTSVSANASAGFSIISYAGNGLDNATIGHGLGVTPSFVVIKDRDSNSAGNNWYVFHSSLASGHYLKLNSTSTTAAISGTSNGGIGSVDSDTVNFTQGSSDNKNVNESGDNFIAYCFSNVDSYLKAGSYIGNGSTDGKFVYLGFKPAFVMIKRTNEAASWVLHDNKRAGYNADNDFLHPDLNQAESDGSGGTIDLLSNGFKCRDTTGWRNESSDTYIYLAFAERPFKYANAR